jgi:WD40 repeat protein
MEAHCDGKYHKILAEYFVSKSLYLDEPIKKKPIARKLVEQPWQQTKGKMWDEVTDTLCNLDFIQAKAAAKMTYELVNDFNEALEVIPDNQKNSEAEKARQARMDRYTKDLILFAKGEIKELEIPESITPWNEDKIDEEIERIRRNPNNADKLKDFSCFIGSRTAIFQKYASEFPHHISSQAWHYANDGPVGKSAENISPEIKKTLLLCDQNSRPNWNPLPSALKIILSPETMSRSIVITPDGKQAIQGGDKCCIHWNLSTGQIIKKMEGDRSKNKVHSGAAMIYPIIEDHQGNNETLSVTPDVKLAFSGNNKLYSDNNSCLLWDISSGSVIQTLKGHSASINAVSITPDGSWAISGSDDKTCIVWDLKSGGEPKILEGHLSKVKSVSITPDGKRIISISDEYQGKPVIWDIEKGMEWRTLDTGLENIRWAFITSNGEKGFCIGFWNLKYFDLDTGEVLQKVEISTKPLNYDVISLTADRRRAFTNSTDPNRLADNCVLWDLTTGNILLTLSGHKDRVKAVSITPDGRYGISCSSDQTIILWDLEKGKTITEKNHLEFSPYHISITPDGKFLIGSSKDSVLNAKCTFIDLEKGIVQHEILATPNRLNSSHFRMYSYHVDSVAITPNGQLGIFGISRHDLYSPVMGEADEIINKVNVYDLLKGSIIQNLSGHTNRITDLSITENGRYAISSSWDESCIIWDIETGEKLKTLTGHRINFGPFSGDRHYVDKMCLGPDNKYILFNTFQAGCRVWNLLKGEIVPITPPKGKAVSNTPDGKWVISIVYYIPAAIIVWNLKTGKEFRVLKHDSNSLSDVSVSPDGRRIITVSSDGTCFLWDIESGKLISAHISAFGIYSVKYLPQGIFVSNRYDEFGFLHSDKKMLCPGIAIVTIKQIWDFVLNRFTEPLVHCPLCGHCFEAPNNIIKTIIDILHENNIQIDQSPCLELQDEAWEHLGLLGDCPSCHEPLKYNPFFGSDQKNIEAYIVTRERRE